MVYETPRQEQRAGEQSIRALYESKPYPGLGDKPKDTGNWVRPIRHLLPKGELRYLDAGCGTGHSVVGMAKAFPEWRYHAMDISRPSLDIAVQLAERFGVEVQYGQGSYLDPLQFSGPFDLIACFGSIVVCQDPVRAIRNLLNYLSADGILMLWLYCKEGHEPRMVTKEILSVFEPDVFQHQRRFQLYRELKEKQRPGPISFLLDLSLRRVLRAAHNRLLPEHFRRQSFEYDYTEPDQLWTDNFCIPFEHHHNVLDLKVLAEASGLDVFLLTGQGREDLDLLPAAWREPFRKLDKWSKWRLMELLSYRHPRAMQVYGRRQNSASF